MTEFEKSIVSPLVLWGTDTTWQLMILALIDDEARSAGLQFEIKEHLPHKRYNEIRSR